MGLLTVVTDDSAFNLERKREVTPRFPWRTYPGIEITMNLDMIELERETSTLLDSFASIGGFYGLATSLLASLVPWLSTSDV